MLTLPFLVQLAAVGNVFVLYALLAYRLVFFAIALIILSLTAWLLTRPTTVGFETLDAWISGMAWLIVLCGALSGFTYIWTPRGAAA